MTQWMTRHQSAPIFATSIYSTIRFICGVKECQLRGLPCRGTPPDHKFTPKSCAEAGVGGKGSPQALGSAGRYPHTCHQATGMIGEKTRPRLLHVRYRRIPMYGSISTGTLPNHQRDPMEGDCLTKHSASWACKGGGASNPSGLGQTGG